MYLALNLISNRIFFAGCEEFYIRLVLKFSAFSDYGRKSVPGFKAELG